MADSIETGYKKVEIIEVPPLFALNITYGNFNFEPEVCNMYMDTYFNPYQKQIVDIIEGVNYFLDKLSNELDDEDIKDNIRSYKNTLNALTDANADELENLNRNISVKIAGLSINEEKTRKELEKVGN